MSRRERRLLLAAGLLAAAAVVSRFLLMGARFAAALCLSAACALALWLGLCRWARRAQAGARCRAAFLACLWGGLLTFALLEGAILSHAHPPAAGPVDAVIVLGAGVNGTTPSLALQTRIDAAAAFLADRPDLPVVLSGGQGPGEDITEAEAMYRALAGVGNPDRYILEDRSTSTAENFAHSRALLEARGVDPDTARIAVVSNDFHLCRAERIARAEGLDTVGVPAPLPGWWLSVNYYVREAFALANTLLFQI